jgi:hypothetical protein
VLIQLGGINSNIPYQSSLYKLKCLKIQLWKEIIIECQNVFSNKREADEMGMQCKILKSLFSNGMSSIKNIT